MNVNNNLTLNNYIKLNNINNDVTYISNEYIYICSTTILEQTEIKIYNKDTFQLYDTVTIEESIKCFSIIHDNTYCIFGFYNASNNTTTLYKLD